MQSSNNSNILILEDDPDQMRALVSLAQGELRKIIEDEDTDDQQKRRIQEIRIIKVNNTGSLKAAVSTHKNVLLAVLDCNTPDTKDGVTHDQLVKTNHIITGQHNAVDIVTKHIPNTPITLISSLDRFNRTVNRYYESKHNLTINFKRKSDPAGIAKNVERYLRAYLESIE